MEARRKCEKLEEEKDHHHTSVSTLRSAACPSPGRPKPSAMSHDMDVSPLKSINERDAGINDDDDSCFMIQNEDSPPLRGRIGQKPVHRQTISRRMSMIFPPSDRSPDIIETKRPTDSHYNDDDDDGSVSDDDSDTVDGDEEDLGDIDTLTTDSPNNE